MNSALIPIAKLAGAALVTASGGLTGFMLAQNVEAGHREMERLESALVFLSGEISYSLTPLPEALSRTGSRVGGKTGALFSAFGDCVGYSKRQDAAEALEQAISDSGGELAAPALEVLRDLTRNLGTSGHKEQVRYIEISIDKAKRLREQSGADCQRRAKLYRYLGFLGGLGVVIVLF